MEALGASSGSSAAGIAVTEHRATTLAAVYAAVRVIAESLASLPVVTYERIERGKQRAPSHPVYQLLHERPNPEMTPFQFIETMTGHALLTGNGYAEIEWNGRAQPVALWPIVPDRVRVERTGGAKRFVVSLPSGESVVIAPENMLHLPGFGFDGLVGHSPVKLMRQTLSLALAAEEFGARFYGNGSRPGGIITVPGKLSREAKERIKASWEQMQGGLSNTHRVALLEEGMSWQQVTINPDDAQFLATREFQVTEIARIFRVPPHMIGDLTRSTFSNIEQQSLEFVIHTLRPWAVRWEQAVGYALFSDYGAGQYFAEFVMDALLRGDLASRYGAYAIGRNNGWLSANDIRERENMNPLPGDQGDVYLVPVNMAPADQVANQVANQAGGNAPAQVTDGQGQGAPALMLSAGSARTHGDAGHGDKMPSCKSFARDCAALESVFRDAMERVRRRENVARERAAKRGAATLFEALDGDHESTVARMYTPAMRALVILSAPDLSLAAQDALARTMAETHAARHIARLRESDARSTDTSGEAGIDPVVALFAEIEEYFPTTPITAPGVL